MHRPRDPLLLTKFDVAERQLNQAILLFFDEGDPVSIHTLAEASSQILYDIRSDTGSVSFARDTDRIKPEYKRDWLNAIFKSRNFFKHADKDRSEVHEFKDEFNHFSLFDGTNMYLTAKRAWTPESMIYIAWFCASYPKYVIEGTDFDAVVSRFVAGPTKLDITNRRLFAQGIRALRDGTMAVPGVNLSRGLPK